MTFPQTDNLDELRQKWLQPYLTLQGKQDTKFRSALISAAEQAYSQITDLGDKTTFSAGVKSAQLRLVMQQVQSVHNDLFKRFIPIITDGQKSAAVASVSAFSETDRNYLTAASKVSGKPTIPIPVFLESQRLQAARGVVNAVSRITKTDTTLSTRVYRTRNLANNWVKKQVNSAILRNASAKEIALAVRSSIRPNVAGGVSYAALRLGRTELNNAFHATAITTAQDRPWITGMDWNLSATHQISHTHLAEICEVYAATKHFDVDHVPSKPHPQCRCFVTPETEALSTFVAHLTAGQYNDWIYQNAA